MNHGQSLKGCTKNSQAYDSFFGASNSNIDKILFQNNGPAPSETVKETSMIRQFCFMSSHREVAGVSDDDDVLRFPHFGGTYLVPAESKLKLQNVSNAS